MCYLALQDESRGLNTYSNCKQGRFLLYLARSSCRRLKRKEATKPKNEKKQQLSQQIKVQITLDL